MRLVPRLPRRSRSHVLHLGRLFCRRLGLCEWRQAQTHERHTCDLMGGVHSGMEPGECGDTRGRASLWKQCRAGVAVFSNLWLTPPRQVVDRCRSALGPMLRCRRDAQLMLLELGEGHGVEHLVRAAGSRSWWWIALQPRGAARSGSHVCTCSVSSSALVSSSAFRVGSSLVSSECSSRSSPSDLARCEAADVEVCISALTSGLDVGVWRELNEKLGGLRSRKRVGTLQGSNLVGYGTANVNHGTPARCTSGR